MQAKERQEGGSCGQRREEADEGQANLTSSTLPRRLWMWTEISSSLIKKKKLKNPCTGRVLKAFSLHCSQTLCVGTYTATKIYLFSQIFEDLYGHGQCWRHFNSQPSTDSRGVRKPYVHGLFSVMLFASLRFLLALFKMSPGTVVEEDEGRTRSKQVLPDTAGPLYSWTHHCGSLHRTGSRLRHSASWHGLGRDWWASIPYWLAIGRWLLGEGEPIVFKGMAPGS